MSSPKCKRPFSKAVHGSGRAYTDATIPESGVISYSARKALITHIYGKRKRHIPQKRKNYIIRSSEAEDSYLSSDLGKTGVVGSREGKNVALLGLGLVTFV